MDRIGKSLSLLLILIISLTIVESASAQTIPKPAVPEFSVRYVDYSYDVPPIYGIDQFTGNQAIIKNGYHIENETFEFTIKNQPFTAYVDSYGNSINLFYNLRFKGFYGTEWIYFPFLDNGQGVRRYAAGFYQFYDPNLQASNSSYTIILEKVPILFYNLGNPPIGSQVDFQVQALIGYVSYAEDFFYSFAGQKSDWSKTQTITIPETSTSTSTSPNHTPTSTQNPTPTPSVPEFSWLIILPLFIFLLSIAVIARFRKIQGITQR